jgi:hypothetical protein
MFDFSITKNKLNFKKPILNNFNRIDENKYFWKNQKLFRRLPQ